MSSSKVNIKDTKGKEEQSELIVMMKGLQLSFKQQGDKMDTVVNGQNEVKAAVKNLESKLETVEKEMSNIKADHDKLAEEFSLKFQQWSERITAFENSLAERPTGMT